MAESETRRALWLRDSSTPPQQVPVSDREAEPGMEEMGP